MRKTHIPHFVTALLVLTGLSSCAGMAQARTQVRIAVVNPAELVQKAPQAQAARERLKRKFSGRRNKLQNLKKRIQNTSQKISRDSAAMSSDELQKKQDSLHTKKRRFNQLQQNYNEDVHQDEKEEFGKLRQLIHKVIIQVAHDKGYDLVLSNGIVYATNRIDITDQVLEQLRAQSSAGG